MPLQSVSSWGNVIRADHPIVSLGSRHADFPDVTPTSTVLPFGNGRSYGDSCLNVGGALLTTRSLDRFISFNQQTGVLACESGVLLADILELVVPAGWFPPVTPGTSFVTIGGAIANDVHGKNHHRAGTFGRHVRRFELLRSDGERLLCSPTDNAEWFAATLGGLGLTGLVTWAEIQLRPIAGPWMDVETVRFGNLGEFFALCAASDRDFEYTVSWVDCLARGERLGRGIMQRANHSAAPAAAGETGSEAGARRLSVPITPPVSLVNAASLRLFNTVYYHRGSSRLRRARRHFHPFFYPLDGMLNWNRLYGPRGFYQYQCVVPGDSGPRAVAQLLETISRSGLGSFLAVLKVCGASESPGILSFPQPGVSLALDFPNNGARLERMFGALDNIVAAAGGRLYPAKDGRMPGALFRAGYPRWREFSEFIDPRCSSSFWRRVTEEA